MNLIYKLLLSMTLLLSTTYASQTAPTQEEVAKLYVATFNRAPDIIGLTYWTEKSFGGHPTLSQIAQSFFDAPETQALYPVGTSNKNFVRSVYANLFNRLPDTDGWNYWEKELNEQRYSKNRFIETVINAARNSADGQDATILANKTRVGLSFSKAGLSDVNDARAIMIGVSEDAATMASSVARFGIELYVAHTTDGSPTVPAGSCEATTTYNGRSNTQQLGADGKFACQKLTYGSNSAVELIFTNGVSTLDITQVTVDTSIDTTYNGDKIVGTLLVNLKSGIEAGTGSSSVHGAFNCVTTYALPTFPITIYDPMDILSYASLDGQYQVLTDTCPTWVNDDSGVLPSNMKITMNIKVTDTSGMISNIYQYIELK